MSQRFYGSVCITDLLQKVKEGHSSVSKSASNGKMYASINLWINDTPDEFGNSASIVLNSTIAGKSKDGKAFYIGNLKLSEGKPINKNDLALVNDVLNADVPTYNSNSNASDISAPVDDLPF